MKSFDKGICTLSEMAATILRVLRKQTNICQWDVASLFSHDEKLSGGKAVCISVLNRPFFC